MLTQRGEIVRVFVSANVCCSKSTRIGFTDLEHAFIVKHYYQTMLYVRAQNVFKLEFPDKSVPNKLTTL